MTSVEQTEVDLNTELPFPQNSSQKAQESDTSDDENFEFGYDLKSKIEFKYKNFIFSETKIIVL